jgi:hypothetical protein
LDKFCDQQRIELLLPLFKDSGMRKVDDIKKACGFKPEFDLLAELRGIQIDLRGWRTYQPVTAKAKRAFVKSIAFHSGGLSRLLKGASDDELAYLVGDAAARPYEKAHGTKWSSVSDRLRQVAKDFRWLEEHAEAARKREMPLGRREGHRLDSLFLVLRRLYVKAFGIRARRVTATGDIFSGKFLEFCVLVLPLFGERKLSNPTLGAIAIKAIAAVDKELRIKKRRRNK